MINLVTETPLKIADVCERFGVHRRTVENWFDQGLESVKVGRFVFTSLEAIQRFSKPRTPSPYRIYESASPYMTQDEVDQMRRDRAAMGV